MATDVLTPHALNRATLERQLLLHRSGLSAHQVIAHLVGMQAQNPNPPYWGLWSRLQHFAPDELEQLILERRTVRVALMRGTIHLVTAEDCLALRPLLQPELERELASNQTYGRHRLAGLNLDELAAAGRALLTEKPRTNAQLRRELAPGWPDHDPAALVYAVRALVPLVHVPPRGLWRRSGPIAFTSAQEWLGRDLDPAPSLAALIRRYLSAFGPASVADMQTWSGLTRLREVVDEIQRSAQPLRAFRAESGGVLFDLPDAPRPDSDTPEPVRFLPEFDNVLLSHADRTRVISDETRKRLISKNGVRPGVFLVGGVVSGAWKISDNQGRSVLAVSAFSRVSKQDASAIRAEGERLLDFAAPDAVAHDIRLTTAP